MAARTTDDRGRDFDSIWLRPERRPRGARRDRDLSRAQIVDVAIAIADAEGIEAVTMRRIATTLGAGTMSLYWHVPSKEHLLELMRDVVIGEVTMPDPPSGDWRADLRQIAYESRATMKRHPWMTSIFASAPGFGPNMLRHADLSLAAVDGLGLDTETMFRITSVVDDYVMGFTLGEINQAAARQRSGRTDQELREHWSSALEPYLRQAVATGSYPRLARVQTEPIEFFDMDRVFAFGLECVLDGVAVRIAERRESEVGSREPGV
jgi:AcrR family transcriptional regulator